MEWDLNNMCLKLAELSLKMEQAYWDYIQEWESAGEKIVPYSSSPHGRDYKTILLDIEAAKEEETCPQNLVPAHTYFLVNDQGRILGAINIRHRLNDYLMRYGGHIGYGVRPAERKKGYARIMLKEALKRCSHMNIDRVLITCTKGNEGSARTIISNGGILENEVQEDREITQRYWIKLDE